MLARIKRYSLELNWTLISRTVCCAHLIWIGLESDFRIYSKLLLPNHSEPVFLVPEPVLQGESSRRVYRLQFSVTVHKAQVACTCSIKKIIIFSLIEKIPKVIEFFLSRFAHRSETIGMQSFQTRIKFVQAQINNLCDSLI